MIVEILAIGTEVVEGDVVNTNASWLAQRCSKMGLTVKYHTAIPDDENLIISALERATNRAQLVLITGGLGPTLDDFTLEVAAKFFGQKLKRHIPSLRHLQKIFKKLGIAMTPNQERQVWLPANAIALLNPVGTAPGAFYTHCNVHYAFFPGVPREMEAIFEKSFLPLLLKKKGTNSSEIARKNLLCFGLPEGQLDHRLREKLTGRGEWNGVQVGFRLNFPFIELRLKSVGKTLAEAKRKLGECEDSIKKIIGEPIFGEDRQTLSQVVGDLLRKKKLRIAVAESCTGGLLASQLTDVPGSSKYCWGGVVTYSNQAKQELLGISEKILARHGAVSAAVAKEMARGIRRISGADLAVAITGIAGPTGGSPNKPVGTVHIALVHATGEWEQRYQFPLGRDRFKLMTVATALDKVRRFLLSKK